MLRYLILALVLVAPAFAQNVTIPGRLVDDVVEWESATPVSDTGALISLVRHIPGQASLRHALAVLVCNLEAPGGDSLYVNLANPTAKDQVATGPNSGGYQHPRVPPGVCRPFNGVGTHTAALRTAGGGSVLASLTSMYIYGD